jgi:hypothetical protein
MPLWKLREERKRLGPGARKGPKTRTLVLLLILVLILIWYLGQVG